MSTSETNQKFIINKVMEIDNLEKEKQRLIDEIDRVHNEIKRINAIDLSPQNTLFLEERLLSPEKQIIYFITCYENGRKLRQDDDGFLTTALNIDWSDYRDMMKAHGAKYTVDNRMAFLSKEKAEAALDYLISYLLMKKLKKDVG